MEPIAAFCRAGIAWYHLARSPTLAGKHSLCKFLFKIALLRKYQVVVTKASDIANAAE